MERSHQTVIFISISIVVPDAEICAFSDKLEWVLRQLIHTQQDVSALRTRVEQMILPEGKYGLLDRITAHNPTPTFRSHGSTSHKRDVTGRSERSHHIATSSDQIHMDHPPGTEHTRIGLLRVRDHVGILFAADCDKGGCL